MSRTGARETDGVLRAFDKKDSQPENGGSQRGFSTHCEQKQDLHFAAQDPSTFA
jgi:hypothetical protein